MQRTTPWILGVATTVLVTGAAAHADAPLRIERRLDLSPGQSATVEVDGGTISVWGGSRQGAHVRIFSRSDELEEQYEISISETSSGVSVRAKRHRKGPSGWFSHTPGLRLELVVPTRTAVSASTSSGSVSAEELHGPLRLRTSGGSVSVGQIVGNVSASTSGGTIMASDVDGSVELSTSGGGISVARIDGAVDTETSGGTISIEDVSGDARAETSGGGIAVRGAGGRVDASTSGGGVTVELVPGNDRGGRVSSSGGPIVARVDPTVGLDIEARASGGSVRVEDLPLDRRESSRSRLVGTMNGGGSTLELTSSGGSVRIEPLR